MRRSKARRGKKAERLKTDYKRAFALFLAGIVVGLSVFLGYKFFPSPRPSPQRGEGSKIFPLPRGERVRVRGQAKVAIVLDDFGYNYNNVEAVFNLKRPVTFAILPHQPYSKTISRRVYQKGYQGILHLPLEPYKDERVKPELNTITVDMRDGEVLDRLSKALEDVPYAKGVSNHQGSRATEDEALMQTILEELKRRRLFFLDSLVTNKSVCRKFAKKVCIGFGRRNVFLDNNEDFEYIKRQMGLLVGKAKRSGSAIGIGHDREKTIAALAKLLPEAEKEGVEFVFLSELIK